MGWPEATPLARHQKAEGQQAATGVRPIAPPSRPQRGSESKGDGTNWRFDPRRDDYWRVSSRDREFGEGKQKRRESELIPPSFHDARTVEVGSPNLPPSIRACSRKSVPSVHETPAAAAVLVFEQAFGRLKGPVRRSRSPDVGLVLISNTLKPTLTRVGLFAVELVAPVLPR